MKFNIKKIIAFTLILITFYSFFSIFPPICSAFGFKAAENFIKMGKEKQGISDGNLTKIGEEFTDIGKVLVYIGAGVLVGGLGYIGIMYMVSPPEKRAKLKQQLIGVLVAGVVIFGAYSIWSVLIRILSGTIDG